MTDVTRRQILGTAGAAALAPLAVAAPAANNSAGSEAVPSGRADGVRTGGARPIKLSSGHEVWTKQVGHGPIPMLTLHGGPGATHFYLECFEDFLPRDRVRFWYYDQLGCGFSDAPDDTSLWTVDRYRAEVEEVRAALGVERLVLYGQSWGGMLGIEYALAFPERVERLIVSNMTASVPSYVEYDDAPQGVAAGRRCGDAHVRRRGQVRRTGVPGAADRAPLQQTHLSARSVA